MRFNPDITYAQLEATVLRTGLWDNGRRQGSYDFRLSPQCYTVTSGQHFELDELATALHRALLGLSRIMSVLGKTNQLRSAGATAWIWRTLLHGAPYRQLGPLLASQDMPVLLKVDMMLDLQGNFWIAEVDATNPRSWGYSVLRHRIAKLIAPKDQQAPGVVPYLAAKLKAGGTSELTLLYGYDKRFYIPDFEILRAEFAAHGITMTVVSELDISFQRDGLVDTRTGQALPSMMVELPPLRRNGGATRWLSNAARDRRLRFLIPPKHYLSSKAMLAVLGNPCGDRALEEALLSHIAETDIALIRRFIPPTFTIPQSTFLPERPAYMLKARFSSGAKGVWFPDDEAYASAVRAARERPHDFVFQHFVVQLPHPWAVYTPSGQLAHSDGWRLRITGYASDCGMQDYGVTARQNTWRIHGQPDAIQTGTVIT